MKTGCWTLLLALAVQAEDGALPWMTGVKEARAAAARAQKPCLLLVNSDGPAL